MSGIYGLPQLSATGVKALKFQTEARPHRLVADQVTKRLAQISGQAPVSGIQDNTVNRLLLMSSAEHYLPNVSMAFFIKDIPFGLQDFVERQKTGTGRLVLLLA